MFRLLKTSLMMAILCSITSSISVAQTTISGKVLDAQTKVPLARATIQQVNTTNGVVAKDDGSFELSLFEDAKKSIEISFLGYKNKTLDFIASQRNLEILMAPETFINDEVLVEATRVDESIPVTFSDLDKDDIQKQNLGQDVPYLLNLTPSTVVTSDAGAGIGYTGIRIRGVDPARINVTINGIPVNDAESHSVFWVNLPDIASSIENIQVQRGVGTSTNGAAAFGGSVNLQTSSNSLDPYAEINTGIGSFNTRKANIQLGSGLMKNGWSFEGRLSQIKSDGYIDRASSDLNSYYLSASKRGERSLLRADVFSGNEVTYQAWNGVEESVLESGNRTFNELGLDKPGEPYEDQVDDYGQDYYQLHYSYRLQDNWTLNTSLHYTKGAGFYEEYKGGEDLADYGIEPVNPTDTTESDLIRRRWLDNDFYGMVFSTKYTHSEKWNITFGGGLNKYDGDHFGEVIWARFAGKSENNDRYYDNNAIKIDGNIYGKAQYFFNEKLSSYLDLQVRRISYEFDGIDVQNNAIVNIRDTDELTFFNPKVGLSYLVSEGNRVFASFGIASKEPTRDEYVESSRASRPDPETLYNLETGYRGDFGRFFVGAYGYAMLYKDQLVVNGQINDVGGVVRQNVPESSRLGIELEGGISITPQFSWAANATFSKNKIDSYTEFIDDYDNGGQIERTFSDTDIALSPSVIANSVFGFSEKGFTTELTTKYVSKQYLDNTQNDDRSIDPYLVNDLRVSYSFTSLSFAKAITANLLVNNLLNEKYETNGYTFGFVSGGEQRVNYYYPQAERNFLLQVKWEF